MKSVMLNRNVGLAAAAAVAAVAMLPVRALAVGCEKDVDCKGDRICINGSCEEPAQPVPPPPPQGTPPPQGYQPPPPGHAPPSQGYQPEYQPPPPRYYQPAPYYYAPPVPPRRRWASYEPPAYPSARSFLAVGGVGYLNPPVSPLTGGNFPSYGGVSVEAYWLFHTFRAPGADGGVTINFGEDLAFWAPRADLLTMNTGWVGVGYDFGFGHWFQFGPRIAIGYAYADTLVSPYNGWGTDGMLLIGGHVNVWFTRFFGLYFEPDGMYVFGPGGSGGWAPRLAGGLAFSW